MNTALCNHWPGQAECHWCDGEPPAFRTERIGDATLILGDCSEVMPTLARVDAVVTDPPYGIGQDGGRGHRLSSRAKVQARKGWDGGRPEAELFDMLRRLSDEQIIWGGNYFADILPPRMGWLYWQKLIGGDFSDGELAWTSRERALKEFSYRKTNAEMEHPTQKPVALMKWCLGFVPAARVVMDPFMGVGSTGVACVQMGRSFIGIERDPDYFDIACRRIEEAYRQRDLFIEPPKPEPVKQTDIFGTEAA